MKKIFGILFIASVVGTITVVLSLVLTTAFDGDVYHGRVTDIHRNDNFFTARSEVLNSALILPRYFLKVTQNSYKIQTNMETQKEGYGGLNLIIGMVAFVLLLLTYSIYDRGLVGKIFSLVYTFYWSFVTIFMYIHFFKGISLFTTNTWGG
jgi:hypothetical protein